MKNLYLLLALLGAVVPYVFFGQHIAAHGLNLGVFMGAAFTNPAAAGFTSDVLISSVVFWVLLVRSGEGSRAWLFVALNLTIGLSCALPAWLYVRERARLHAT